MKATSKSIRRPREPQVGSRIGQWTVLSFYGTKIYPDGSKRRMWLCRCSCELRTERPVLEKNLRTGSSTNCGNKTHRQHTHHRTHGEARKNKQTPEYRSWKAMMNRCNNPNGQRYVDYGGRGITVCDRWLDYNAFLADMGRRPSPRHSLERIDNNLGYNPQNCEWATPAKQNTNRRDTVMAGDVPLAVLAQKHNLPAKIVRGRIRLGWSLEDALTRPVGPRTRS